MKPLSWIIPGVEPAERLGWCLLHFLWQGAAIAAALALVLRFCRKGSADLRHALCGIALLGLITAPLVTWARLGPSGFRTENVAAPAAGKASPLANQGGVPFPPDENPRLLFLMESTPAAIGSGDEGDGLLQASKSSPGGKPHPPRWLRALGWFWLAGVALAAFWRALGLCGTAWLIHRAGHASDVLREQVAAMARRCGLRKTPPVRITGRLMSPAVAGVFRPVLLLPAAALAGLSPRELDFILAHEFAHIRRHDFLLGLLQAAVETLFFFHPAVWWISHRMGLEREHACDDAAMRVTGNRRAGATALARLAELQLEATLSLAPAAGGSRILQRVRRLLEPGPPPQGGSPLMAASLLLLGILLTPFLLQRAESQETPAALPAVAEPETAPAAPVMRGSITDRNGVILAESIASTWVRNGETISGERRRYPLGPLASHLIGYTRQGQGETEPDTGIAGVEKRSDSSLRSVATREGKPQPALTLTLDARMQQICRKALIEAGAGRAAAVVLDITNGDILASVSLPDFDLNQFTPFITNETFRQLTFNPAVPLANRAVSAYPPGSTFKLITALAAGESGEWNQRYECSGSVTYAGRQFNCWTVQTHTAPHGIIALPEALQRSCNCYFYQLGNAAGIDKIAHMAKNFGLGDASSFRMGSQMTDFIPDRAWWEGQSKGSWTASKTANVSIGQGEVQATPLQMAAVAAAVANGGKIWNPRLISRTLMNGVWQAEPLELRHDLIREGVPAETIDALRQGMYEAVHAETGGTGKPARSSLIAIAGKTGTAQKWRIPRIPLVAGKTGTVQKWPQQQVPDNHTQFIGFAPFEKPRYAFSIVVANGKSGGGVCAPIAKRIMESIELLNRGELAVELKPEPPAQGHFDFIESVTYPEASQ